MVSKKINSVKMKQNNAKVVLDSIRFAERISRKELAAKIGLTPATITNIVNHLLKEKYIKEVGEETTRGGGRRPILLSINENACYVLGVELVARKITCILTDFTAEILHRKTIEIDPSAEADVIISQTTETIETVILESKVEREKIRGIGLSTLGPCDSEKGIMINPPNLTAFQNFPIKEVIEEMTGFPVVYEHHTVAAGFCEGYLGKAKKSKCMVLCSVLEIGIACSIFIDGKIFHGFHNTSGEIGHMIIDRNGQKCTCGNYGCLEPMADARALVNAVKKKLRVNPGQCREYGIEDVDEIDLEYILSREKEPFFQAELIACAQYVGIALCNVIMILSPDTIVLAGDLPERSALYVREVQDFIKSRAYPQHSGEIQIYRTEFGSDVGALGGVALVLEKMSQEL